MKIAVDKNSIDLVQNNDNYVYLYDSESLEDLLAKNIHCIQYKNCDFVDINLTNYDVECLKKAKPTDENYDKLPDKIDYKFAVIVPNFNNDRGEYNGKTFLQNCIESILNQTYKNFELIFVDDMSTDNSVATVRSYNDKKIHIIENKRKRYNGGSRNVGIDYALDNLDFDYFCFLDSDDWWKDQYVLEKINSRLYGHELMTLGCEMLHTKGITARTFNEAKCYEDLWSLNNRVWCTAWARVIRKDKIAFFCEDTLMEDRVWSYKIADNVDFNNVINLKQIVYVWNRMNTTNSVSIVRNDFWNASAYCHVGHQLQFISQIKHKNMILTLQSRVKECERRINNNIYQQF